MFVRKLLHIGLLCVTAAALIAAGTGCDMESLLVSGGDPLSLLGPEGGLLSGGEFPGEGGEFNRSFTTVDENGRTNSFSFASGIDPGESLETFLSGSIVY